MIMIIGSKPLEQVIHGDYVATPIKNAFNNKTAYWISKRGYAKAFYMFTVEECISVKDMKDRLTADAFRQYESWFDNAGTDIDADAQNGHKIRTDNLAPVLNAIDASNRSFLGDFVICTNCGRYMLVNHGQAECPECGEDTLMWADKVMRETEPCESRFRDQGYELLDRPSYEAAREALSDQ